MATSHAEATSSSHRQPTAPRPRIGIVGYGEGAGREHARRLRDRGHDVHVGMLPGGMSWIQATKDGFRPMRAHEAVIDADVVVLLVPQDEVELVYWEEVEKWTVPGAIVVFTDEIDLDASRLPKGADVAVIAMRDEGCLLTIKVDATGRARERALAYLQWLGADVPRPASSKLRVADGSDPFPHPMRRVL